MQQISTPHKSPSSVTFSYPLGPRKEITKEDNSNEKKKKLKILFSKTEAYADDFLNLYDDIPPIFSDFSAEEQPAPHLVKVLVAVPDDTRNKEPLEVDEDSTIFNLKWYTQNIWNKSFSEMIENIRRDSKLIESIDTDIYNMCRSHYKIKNKDLYHTLSNFLIAGEHNRDFVQLTYNNNPAINGFSRHYLMIPSDRFACAMCLNLNPSCLFKMVQQPNSNPYTKQNRRAFLACKGCFRNFMSYAMIFHHLWYVSKPLKNFDYQGYKDLPDLDFEFGSAKKEDIQVAFEHFKEIVNKVYEH